MLRQATNKVFIEGILSEIDIKEGSFTKKTTGQTMKSYGGRIMIKTVEKVGDKFTDLEIPVHVFAPEFKNDGGKNPAYISLENLKDNFVSIAACGSEEEADRIRITSGSIEMNEYSPDGATIISFPRVKASFFSKVKKSEYNPKARFEVEMVVGDKIEEVNREGIETGRLMVKGIVPEYGGKVDVVPFYVESQTGINDIQQYWQKGDTVKAAGRLNFTSTTETVLQEMDFGDPIERTRTTTVSDLIITGGLNLSDRPELKYDEAEIQNALIERKARIELEKDKAKTRGTQAPTQAAATSGFDDLGF